MKFSVLSSGSKANATFVETGATRFLIDCGLSGRQIEKRLLSLGVNPDTLNAIIVTHEHRDHICGIGGVSRKYRIPVYMNTATSRFVRDHYAREIFETGADFYVGEAKISPFSITHDAADPVGFVVEHEGIRFTQATDFGRVTPVVRHAFEGAHAIVIESNHDQEMLQSCNYAWSLKQRIASTHGHLSNDSAGAVLSDLWHSDLKHVVLAHLSENSNTPDVALRTVCSYLKHEPVSLHCGSIAKPTELFHLDGSCSVHESTRQSA